MTRLADLQTGTVAAGFAPGANVTVELVSWIAMQAQIDENGRRRI